METFGSRVDAANGGVPALDCLSQSRYDVVITDLEMPDLNGYVLACWIREKSPATRVVVMTGRSHSEVARYVNTGMVDHWIFKPFRMNDLETVLNNIVSPDLQESFR
jgi:two-component system response regulator YesN